MDSRLFFVGFSSGPTNVPGSSNPIAVCSFAASACNAICCTAGLFHTAWSERASEYMTPFGIHGYHLSNAASCCACAGVMSTT
jgi:hypothetical protein